jgi:hypothetical protein
MEIEVTFSLTSEKTMKIIIITFSIHSPTQIMLIQIPIETMINKKTAPKTNAEFSIIKKTTKPKSLMTTTTTTTAKSSN